MAEFQKRNARQDLMSALAGMGLGMPPDDEDVLPESDAPEPSEEPPDDEPRESQA